MHKLLPELIIWGGTGNFKVLCELLKNEFHIIGFFDNNPAIQKDYQGIPNLGTWEDFLVWVHAIEGEKPAFMVSIGPGHGAVRQEMHEKIKSFKLKPITAIHRTAFVAESVQMEEGSQVYANATISVETKIGKACIINTRASIDHECVLEDGATVGPGAILAGLVQVGPNADIYSGAVVLPRIRIGANAIVGAGAVVLENVPDGAVVVGNPARILRK